MIAFQPANEQLGYFFHPATELNAVGHPQLDVVLRPAPTGDHFDPESVGCLIATASGSTRLHITHPWTQETAYRICAGEIDLEDRRHEHVRVFTFGGDLRIHSDARRTVCQIASPAPLLVHARQDFSLAEHLIEEIYILFAQRRAAQDDDDFDRQLATVEPLQLYHACLVALNQKFEHFPVTDDVHRRFKQFLTAATQSWAGEAVPSLADLL